VDVYVIPSIIGAVGVLIAVYVTRLTEKIGGFAARMDLFDNIITDLPTDTKLNDKAEARLEALERRMEEVHEDCKRYLQKAATAQSRAKKLAEGVEGGEDSPGVVNGGLEALEDAISNNVAPKARHPLAHKFAKFRSG
jgi:hypothetical protein